MKNIRYIPFLVMISASSIVNAAGNHSGGHEHATNNAPTAHWMAPSVEAARHNPIESTITSIDAGANLYKQNCMSCHGANADGKGMAGKMLQPKPANLRVMAGTHPDGDFAYKIRQGRGAMPAWKNALNDHQVWHLVNYIQSLDNNSIANEQENHEHTGEHAHGS